MKNLKEDSRHPYTLLRPKEVKNILGCSLPTLYRRQYDEDFPPKIKISNGIVGWKKCDILDYIDSKTEAVK